ncbi:F-box/kelch-repeat protein-like protein [Tanacetum coccineum]
MTEEQEDMVLFDVTEEVLLRLTVKDILRCKSVCKSWYSLISSPSFVKTHVKHTCKKEDKTNKQLGNRRIAMTRRYVIRKGDWYTIPPEWGSYHSLRIEGSSNGLVCMSSIENQICLTNPSTREFRKLKKPPILPKKWKRYGFGYDSSTNDYKLVMAIDQGSDDGTLVQIFSLKSNVWKLFGHVDYRFDDASLLEPGILFNGALHWFMYDINRDKILIVSFDLAKEEFKEISQPDDTRYDGSYDNALGIFEDHLCIFDEHNDGRPYGIWVMKNYNVKQSWKLLPTQCEMKDRVHYMIKDSLLSKKMPSYFCSENLFLSTSGKHIWSPIFVQTLVSPYVNNHGRQNDAKNSKRTVKSGTSKEWREIEEAYTLKDGEKNAFHSDEDGETERKKRGRTRSTSRTLPVYRV